MKEHDIPFSSKKAYEIQTCDLVPIYNEKIKELEDKLEAALDLLDDVYHFPSEGKYLDRARGFLKENGYL